MNMLTSLHSGKMPQQTGTIDAFLMDGTIHLRYARFGNDKLYHVKSLSFSNGILMTQWTSQAREQGLPPVANQEVDIYAVRQGVLYMSKGRVLELTSGKSPRIRVKVEGQAAKVNLRKHQRYIVRAMVNLAPAGCQFTYTQQTDHEIDISEGGIGLTIPANALEVPQSDAKPDADSRVLQDETEILKDPGNGSDSVATAEIQVTSAPSAEVEVEVDTAKTSLSTMDSTRELTPKLRLEMTVYAERSGRIDTEQPSLNLSCHAEIRRRILAEGTKDEFLGLQFIDMSIEQHETLRLWLATHSVKLRNC